MELNLDLSAVQPERTRSKLDWTKWKDGQRRLFVSQADLSVAGIETVRIENPTINFRAQCRQQLDEKTEVEFSKHPSLAAQGIDHVFVTFHQIVPVQVDVTPKTKKTPAKKTTKRKS